MVRPHAVLPRILVFASGTSERDVGGSGFEWLVAASLIRELRAEIVGVVSNHDKGGVCTKALRLGVPFYYFPGPWTELAYKAITTKVQPDYIVLYGWYKKVTGMEVDSFLCPSRTINIHGGPLPQFGGPGMCGPRLHQAVLEAYKRGEIDHSAVSIHFVTPELDKGPIIFQQRVAVRSDDTWQTLENRVNNQEKKSVIDILNLVTSGRISWDGKNLRTLKFPELEDYKIYKGLDPVSIPE